MVSPEMRPNWCFSRSARRPSEREEELAPVGVRRALVGHPEQPSAVELQPGVKLVFEVHPCRAGISASPQLHRPGIEIAAESAAVGISTRRRCRFPWGLRLGGRSRHPNDGRWCCRSSRRGSVGGSSGMLTCLLREKLDSKLAVCSLEHNRARRLRLSVVDCRHLWLLSGCQVSFPGQSSPQGR